MTTAELCLVPAVADPLESIMRMVLDSVTAENTKTAYRIALRDFLTWVRAGQRPFNKATVNAWKSLLESRGYAPATVSAKLSPIRKLALEASDNQMLPPEVATAIGRVRGAPRQGTRFGHWLGKEDVKRLLEAPLDGTLRGLRDRALLAVAIGCGLRRAEMISLTFEHVVIAEGRFVIADMIGKGGRVRTVVVPTFAKSAIDRWAEAAGVSTGRVFRPVKCSGAVAGERLSAQTVTRVVLDSAKRAGVGKLAPHDLRRTHAKLAHKAGCPVEEIKAGLGHSNLTTTQIYLGLEQNLEKGPGDYIQLAL